MTPTFKDYNLSNLMTAKDLKEYLHIGKNKAVHLIEEEKAKIITQIQV